MLRLWRARIIMSGCLIYEAPTFEYSSPTPYSVYVSWLMWVYHEGANTKRAWWHSWALTNRHLYRQFEKGLQETLEKLAFVNSFYKAPYARDEAHTRRPVLSNVAPISPPHRTESKTLSEFFLFTSNMLPPHQQARIPC